MAAAWIRQSLNQTALHHMICWPPGRWRGPWGGEAYTRAASPSNDLF